MTSTSWALQMALHQSLTMPGALMDQITGVFDHVPQDQPMPYVVIGDDVMSDWSAKAFSASDHRLTIHIWSRMPGRREARQLIELVQAQLAAQTPAPSGFSLVSLRFVQAAVLGDADGLTQHGIIDYRARLCAL
jgi:hypothetical protein